MKIKLILTIKDTEIELTEEEARELYNKLNGMFGRGYYTYPWTYPYNITCGDVGNLGSEDGAVKIELR